MKIQRKSESDKNEIIINGDSYDHKICLNVGDARELLMAEDGHRTDTYLKLLGHVFTVTKSGIVEVWWTPSHKHDIGANQQEDFLMRYFRGTEVNEQNPNRKVSLSEPIAKERAA